MPTKKCCICGIAQAEYHFTSYQKARTTLCKSCAAKLTREQKKEIYTDTGAAIKHREAKKVKTWFSIPGYSLYEVNQQGHVRMAKTHRRVIVGFAGMCLIADRYKRSTQKKPKGLILKSGETIMQIKEINECAITRFSTKELQAIWLQEKQKGE